MNWDLALTKGISAAIVMGFFALIVFFLRFLYGPKGIFRDPTWDRWNEEARQRLEKEEDAKADARLEAAFLRYAKGFFSGDAVDDAPLHLKVEHSMRVLGFAREIAAREPVFSDHATGRALRLAALFHDVGRFKQYTEYKTFADALSCNHGALGARIILRQGFLNSETPDMRRMVLAAVAAHNRLGEPRGYSGPLLQVLRGLKDADKLDILRVLAESLAPGGPRDDVVLLHLEDTDGAYSETVAEALSERRVALYSDMRYINDFRILLCTWIPDLHFATSRRILQREGHMNGILAGMDTIPAIQKKARALVDRYLN